MSLLSEMIAHPEFRKMMTDSEIYVDRIASSRIHDMNIMLEAVRQTIITEKSADPDDIYMQTIKAAQFSEEAQVAMFLKQLGIKYSKLTKDEFVTLMGILRKSDMLKSPGSKRGKGNRKKR